MVKLKDMKVEDILVNDIVIAYVENFSQNERHR
jgi:hypothetical protein